ncbi:MAG: PQQ-binding-like beta-propeller repeat protein [Verrucomicrobia bacterium]|nr:PQQ-binding-like beta-propeller repeat protein [Verrucomicrobiota bacterium]
MNKRIILLLTSLTTLLCTTPLGAVEEQALREAVERLKVPSSLAVVMGSDGSMEERILAAAPRYTILSVGGDVAAADARRERLAAHAGQVSVQPGIGSAIPVFHRAAALLVVDAEALGGDAPNDVEISRALRPFGTAWVRRGGAWGERRGEWPDTIAEYNHWLGNHRFNHIVEDEEAGLVRSMRWHTGRKHQVGNKIWTSGGVMISEIMDGNNRLNTIGGFCAFSGMQLWERQELNIVHNLSTVMDRERFILHTVPVEPGGEPWSPGNQRREIGRSGRPERLHALDIHTGETLVAYEEGPDMREGSTTAVVNLYDGKLVVAAADSLWVLDAASGKLLWRQHHEGQRVSFPVIANGMVFCTVGGGIGRPMLHGEGKEVMPQVSHVYAYDLVGGEQRWHWVQDVEDGLVSTNFSFTEGHLWLTLGTRRDQNRLLRFDPATGEVTLRTQHRSPGPTDRYVRLFPTDDGMIINRGAPDFFVIDESGQQKVSVDSRSGACLAPRASSRYLYHGTTAIELKPPYMTHRAHIQPGRCTNGVYPSHGMVMAAHVACDCDPYMRSLSAYGDDDPPEAIEPLTVAGPGRPGREVAGDAWRTAFRDGRRSSWAETPVRPDLEEVWRVQLGEVTSGDPLLAAQWSRHFTAATVAGPVLGDGVVVVPMGHRHEVVALDPATGEERWRVRSNGQVDGPVTLAGGMVLYGTTTGWIEARSIDDGQPVWRTRLGLQPRYRVENGQIGSQHPVPASVTVHEGKVYAMAGLHSIVDGGLHWVELDMNSGKVLRSGMAGGEPKPFAAGERNRPGYPPNDVVNPEYISDGDHRWQRMPGTFPSTNLAVAYPMQRGGILTVTPEGWLGLGVLAIDPDEGRILSGGRDFGFVSAGHWGIDRKHAPRYPVAILDGLLSKDGDQVVMGGIRGKAIAYRGARMIGLSASNNHQWSYSPEGNHLAEHLLDMESGAVDTRWTVPLEVQRFRGDGRNMGGTRLRGRTPSEALAVAGEIALVADARRLQVRDLSKEGEQVASHELPAWATQCGIATANGLVIVVCLDGTVIAYR